MKTRLPGNCVEHNGTALSVSLTADWVRDWQQQWPGATVPRRGCWANFDDSGLYDLSPGLQTANCDGSELSAMLADAIQEAAEKNPTIRDNAAFYAACGQFQST